MTKIKAVSGVATAVANAFVKEVNSFAIGIVRDETSAQKGYVGLTTYIMQAVEHAEIAHGGYFEDVSKKSTGALADVVLPIRAVTEKAFTDAGHKQARGAWLKIQLLAREIRNAGKPKESGDTRTFKSAHDFGVDNLLAVYNKAVRQSGESKWMDKNRKVWLDQLLEAGIKPDSKRLASNK